VLGAIGVGAAVCVAAVVVLALVVGGREWPPTSPTRLEWTESTGPQCGRAEGSTVASLEFDHVRTSVPAGDWEVVSCEDSGDLLTFAARASQEFSPQHTYVVELREQHVSPEDAASFRSAGEDGAEFREAVRSRMEEVADGFSDPVARVELVPARPGTDLCVAGDLRVLDHRVPGTEGEAWPMRFRSLTCFSAVGAQPTLTDLRWSERAPSSDELTPLDELGPWLDPFLDDAEFTTGPVTTTTSPTTSSTLAPALSGGRLGTAPELTTAVDGPQCEEVAASSGPGVQFDHVTTVLPDGSWTLASCTEDDGWIDFVAGRVDTDLAVGLVTEHLSPGELSRLRSLGGSETWGGPTEETLRSVFAEWSDIRTTVSPRAGRAGADGCVGFTLDATDRSVPDDPWPYRAVGEVCRVLEGDQPATVILVVEQTAPTDAGFLSAEEAEARFGSWWGAATFSG